MENFIAIFPMKLPVHFLKYLKSKENPISYLVTQNICRALRQKQAAQILIFLM